MAQAIRAILLASAAHPKLAPDLLHIDGAPLVCEARIAGDDEQRLETRQRRDDVIDHSISKVVLFGITAHVGEWQNSDGGLIRKGKGGLRFWRNCCFRFLPPEIPNHFTRRPMFFKAISPFSLKPPLIRSPTLSVTPTQNEIA